MKLSLPGLLLAYDRSVRSFRLPSPLTLKVWSWLLNVHLFCAIKSNPDRPILQNCSPEPILKFPFSLFHSQIIRWYPQLHHYIFNSNLTRYTCLLTVVLFVFFLVRFPLSSVTTPMFF